MRYLKSYKIFEGRIEVPSYHKGSVEIYLKELGTTLDDLNDTFIDVLDYGFRSYLQVLYVSSNGTRWITLDDRRVENGIYHTCLQISFELNKDKDSGVKSRFGDTYYEDNTSVIKDFIDGVDRLKQMFPKREIKWLWNTGSQNTFSTLIFLDDVTINR